MPKLWDKKFTRAQLQAYTSTMETLAGLRPFTYDQGRIRGMQGIDVWTGSGLRFTLWPDSALDLGPAWFKDKPIAWQHPGLGQPANFEPSGLGWLRTFGGGLLTSCGLIHIGAPDDFQGQSYGLHGRIAHIPAENIRLWQRWQDEDYILAVEGEIRQSVLFGENLLLKRRVETALGSRSITVKDIVVNESSRSTPHSLLYHCNFGFPVLGPESRLILDAERVEPRTPIAAAGIADRNRFDEPQLNYEEQVFFHYPVIEPDGYAQAVLFNPELNFGVRLRWLADTMPVLTEWKMIGTGEYVCGLEPATHAMATWADLEKQGLPRRLAPREEIRYELTLSVIENI
ncbi:MAG: aldose 1-epimerase family protein [Anaerolineales bacterium]